MDDFEKDINASDLIDWIMCAIPDWCEGDVRQIVDHIDEMPSAQPEPLKITINPPTADEMERLKQAIRNTPVMLLPSAQPEEDCDTCKHGYFGDDQCNNCRVRYPSHYERRTDEQTD